MTPSGIHSGVGGYDPSLLPEREDRFQPSREAHSDEAHQERDTVVTRVADSLGPSGRPDASPVDRSISTADADHLAHRVTYGRRALATPAATVGLRLDVTG